MPCIQTAFLEMGLTMGTCKLCEGYRLILSDTELCRNNEACFERYEALGREEVA